VDALVVRSETKVTAEVFEAAPRLRVVDEPGSGGQHRSRGRDAARRAGPDAPTGNTIAAAEHTIG